MVVRLNVSLIMRCSHCRKKTITLVCKWCNHDYCSSCIQIETHVCSNIEEAIVYKKEVLQNKLIDQQTYSTKNYEKV